MIDLDQVEWNTAVQSSAFKAAGWHEEESRVVVVFNRDQVWSFAVDRAVFDALVSADSPGQFFHANIKNSTGARREA